MLAIAFYSIGTVANESETISSVTLYHDEAKLDLTVTGVFDQSGMAGATVIETIRPDSLSVIDPLASRWCTESTSQKVRVTRC